MYHKTCLIWKKIKYCLQWPRFLMNYCWSLFIQRKPSSSLSSSIAIQTPNINSFILVQKPIQKRKSRKRQSSRIFIMDLQNNQRYQIKQIFIRHADKEIRSTGFDFMSFLIPLKKKRSHIQVNWHKWVLLY